MLSHLINYFLPVERGQSGWLIKKLGRKELLIHIVRNGVPCVVFWILQLYFLQSNLMLFLICLIICLPFALITGRLAREYYDQQVDC